GVARRAGARPRALHAQTPARAIRGGSVGRGVLGTARRRGRDVCSPARRRRDGCRHDAGRGTRANRPVSPGARAARAAARGVTTNTAGYPRRRRYADAVRWPIVLLLVLSIAFPARAQPPRWRGVGVVVALLPAPSSLHATRPVVVLDHEPIHGL